MAKTNQQLDCLNSRVFWLLVQYHLTAVNYFVAQQIPRN